MTAYFPEGALIRAVQRERIVALSGARALFMQAAHPVAFVGFFSHTTALEDPHPRLARTALAVNTVIFGSETQAREVQRIVGGMHARVRGRLPEAVGPYPAGTEFRGDDPELLRWILACFIDSSYHHYERFVRPLGADERDALWRQWLRVGEIFGLGDGELPGSYAAHRAYMADMLASGRLVVTPRASELAREVILRPPLPAALLPLREAIGQLTIESLPPVLRRQFGFAPVPGRGIAVGAFARWLRAIGPLTPAAVREVPPILMPAEGRHYGEIVELATAMQQSGRTPRG